MITHTVPFDVYLPATKFNSETGEPLDSEFIKTIYIEVYDNFGEVMLTEKAHRDINNTKFEFLINLYKLWKKDKINFSNDTLSKSKSICL